MPKKGTLLCALKLLLLPSTATVIPPFQLLLETIRRRMEREKEKEGKEEGEGMMEERR